MKKLVVTSIVFSFLLTACDFFPGPREIDWKKEWSENQFKLKRLKNDILKEGGKKYEPGNNNFPDGFDYPFDDGFFIDPNEDHVIDPKNIMITFYMDRGLLDHYSAIVFTNDSTQIVVLEENAKNGGNDFKIERNWYVVND